MKAPAFQFYTDDFIGGTVCMSAEDVGAYIRLLCYQWNHGSTPVHDRLKLNRICGCDAADDVIAKFPNGKNERLESERSKQAQYREQQRLKGIASGAARANRGSTVVQPSGQPNGNSPSPSPSPIEENTPPRCAEVPTEPEFLAYCKSLLIAEWYARDKFLAQEAKGWERCNWRAYARRVRGWFEGDGKPMKPKTYGSKPDTNRNGGFNANVDYSNASAILAAKRKANQPAEGAGPLVQ